ncbi:MAG: DUF3352 domain-containing protein [Cyanobacteria bacterium J06626_6]
MTAAKKSEADGSQADGSQADGSQANGSQVGDSQVGDSQVDRATAPANGPSSRFFSSAFFKGLLSIALTLVLLGVGAFAYLSTSSPLSLLAGSDRPIAAATVFIPKRSPFTLSLLTNPERLLTLEQAIADADQRQIALDEANQLKRTLLEATGLDYDQDIQPWIGDEVTFAYTDLDLDIDPSNGAQPGYLIAVEIAPDRQQQAQSFLQLFWQQQALTGNSPTGTQISGVRVLSSSKRFRSMATATALVGDRFVIFANDSRVIARSIRSAQTAANLAQTANYRESAAQLPQSRLALAYFDSHLFNQPKVNQPQAYQQLTANHLAISFSLTPAGLIANAKLPGSAASQRLDKPVDAMTYLPADSKVALASRQLTQLGDLRSEVGIRLSALPNFLTAGQTVEQTPEAEGDFTALWNWAQADYALGQIGSGGSQDWILVVARDGADAVEGINNVDSAAIAQGYSVVPITIGDYRATAWTRFQASQKRTAAASRLETELLGLHLQLDRYEIFAGSLAAMNSALAAPANSLLQSERFVQAIAPLPQPNQGYTYIDWPALTPTISRAFPLFGLIQATARPLLRHIDVVTATRDRDTASLFIQLKASSRQATSRK